MCRSVVSALGIVVLTGSLAAGQAPAQAVSARAGSAGAHEEPASPSEGHAAAAGRRDHARVQRSAGCGVRSLPIWTKPGDPSNDMAADTKVEKTVARAMMLMTNEINTKLAASIKKPADQIARVEMRHLPSRRGDSRDAAAAATTSAWRSASRPGSEVVPQPTIAIMLMMCEPRSRSPDRRIFYLNENTNANRRLGGVSVPPRPRVESTRTRQNASPIPS